MRHLRLVKDGTSFDFFKHWKLWLGISGFLIVLAMVSFGVRGLNYGIDFRGGTTIRTESTQPQISSPTRNCPPSTASSTSSQ